MIIPRGMCTGWCCCLFAIAAVASGDDHPDTPSFSRDVLPLLADHCFQCHGPDEKSRQGGFRLDQRESATQPADSGAVPIDAGHPDHSELLRRILSTDDSERMPPPEFKRTLLPGQADILRRWIAGGAPWGRHWAYEPIVRPVPPAVTQHADSPETVEPVRNPIDAFVRAGLAGRGLSPAPAASRETLIRRVTLDLTGLPPTPEDVDTFVADPAPDAYDRLVDRLLASPRYGERMAWDWLDAARYADSNGFQGDPERTMHPWRDWVVRALNDNMPYDQFTIEQLAGDLLPEATQAQIIATGFHRNHMHNGEGGRIPEETRVENVMDRVETTATVWLGITMTCARCHDHKYDPFTLQDYYALYDFFNQSSESGQGAGGARSGAVPPFVDFATPGEMARLAEFERRIEQLGDEVFSRELAVFPREEGQPAAASARAAELSGNQVAALKLHPAKRGSDFLIELESVFRATHPEYAASLGRLNQAVTARAKAQSSLVRVMVMDTRPEPRATYILSKGAYDKPTEMVVSAAIPASLVSAEAAPDAASPTAPSAPAPARPRNRLDLARWLVSRANPLTARVTVNRHWQAFFGIGLVKTVEDFGSQGERPAHPALLDWLAAEFVHTGWDVKQLHRLIVTSATYRQSSQLTPRAHAQDPENRLLARGPRIRLPSWMIRDVALSASGLLVDTLGGAAVKPYHPPGIWEEATFGKKTYEQDHGPDLYRRSLYVFWRRIVGPPLFFDNAARQTCTVKTVVTNTPLHALTTLNDVTYVEAARALAQRVLNSSDREHEQLTYAFRLVTGRRPGESERAILAERLHRLRETFAQDGAAAAELLNVGEIVRDESLDVVEHASWAALCSLLLNLDEALTKE
jgi:hypothetical protein